MTKIKIDIESDKDITQANLQIKYADGNTLNKEVINAEIPSKKTETKINTETKKYKSGIDSSFTQTY